VAGNIPAKVVYETDDILAFEDLNPQAPVHVLFIPKRHFATINDMDAADAALAGQLMLSASAYAKSQGFADDGFRLVMNTNPDGGQTVYHVHLHLLGGRKLSHGFGAGA
ncbi:MAG: histidine triad nucleotide-binding protein, partial [Pseudomonadota bacterium]